MRSLPCLLLAGLVAGCAIDRAGLALIDAGRDGGPGGMDSGPDTGDDDSGPPTPEDGGVDSGPPDGGPPPCDPARCEVRPSSTASCVDGACVWTCDALYGDCDMRADNGCEQALDADPMNCGMCGRDCPPRAGTTVSCVLGTCSYDCGGGRFDCDMDASNGCEVDGTTDPLHCGSCAACPGLPNTVASCAASTCSYTCVAGFGDCDATASGCESELAVDPANCGGCGTACPAAPNAMPTCAGSTCGFSCLTGFGDCNGLAADGCEVDLRITATHCGGCGVACPDRPASAPRCDASACGITCDPFFANCNASLADGCEVDLRSDVGHCSACGMACPVRPNSLPSCSGAICGFTCTTGFGDCNGDPLDGCELDLRTDPLHCGSCAGVCPTRANATATCRASTCDFTCNADFGNCDGIAGNGCETDLVITPAHCGSCGSACTDPPNAAPTCVGRTCGFTCDTGYGDCDATAAGCETDLRSTVSDCGTCGMVCPSAPNASAVCAMSACDISCNAGFDDCTLAAGCETDVRTDVVNCGACGTVCATPPNATPRCAGGMCGFTCNTGFGDCDVATAGCETNTNTNVRHCSMCGNVCPTPPNSTPTCAGGLCGFTCVAPFADCVPGSPGCETNTSTDGNNCGGCGVICPVGRTCTAGRCTGWTPTSTTGAPSGRRFHTAVWTGTEMIVWGGQNAGGHLNTGGRYNPATDSWTATSTTGAPSARRNHVALWTGTEMIIWGGYDGGSFLNDGARYNPTMNTWIAMSSSPLSTRSRVRAIWTGTLAVLWAGYTSGGGGDANDGQRYDPSANTWSMVSSTGVPSDRRENVAVWTGSVMVAWGGETGGGTPLADGGRYNVAGNTWATLSTTGAPTGRARAVAVYTAPSSLATPLMLVWGGDTGDGGATPTDALADGGRYDPAGNVWSAMAASPLGPRSWHTAVWSGTQMLVWGGYRPQTGAIVYGDGAGYDPAANSWAPITLTGAPSARRLHTAVWTGTEMIVWGGDNLSIYLDTGGRYRP